MHKYSQYLQGYETQRVSIYHITEYSKTIQTIVDAYNRSNGLNLIALTALSIPPQGLPANEPYSPEPTRWPKLPRLLPQKEIPEQTWRLLREVYLLGLPSPKPGVATVWRHLAQWPGVLALAHAGLSSLVQNESLQGAIQSTHTFAQSEGARIAHQRGDVSSIPDEVRRYVAEYANNVHRMVTIGHIFAGWLKTATQ